MRGAVVSVTASGPQDVLDTLDIRVEGRTLRIERKERRGWFARQRENARITVVAPQVRSAAVGGSGNMSVDRIDGADFEGSVGGSGSLAITQLRVDRARLSVAGSGNATAVGTVRTAALNASGSGNIDATALDSRNLQVSLSGSGNVRARAREAAAGSVSGSGTISISGTDQCAIARSGSGTVSCVR